MPPLPTRLMAGLAILKHTFNLSDEALCERWIENRPAEVNGRETFGHWECDLLIFRKEAGKADVTSLVERKSRFTFLLPNGDRRRPIERGEPVCDAAIDVRMHQRLERAGVTRAQVQVVWLKEAIIPRAPPSSSRQMPKSCSPICGRSSR